MADYFLLSEGKEYGPISSRDLIILANNGKIKPESKIRKENGAWVDAAKVKGLFQEASIKPEDPTTSDKILIQSRQPSTTSCQDINEQKIDLDPVHHTFPKEKTNFQAPSGLDEISRDQLPKEIVAKLFPTETVRYFGFVDHAGGGCAQQTKAKQFVLVTDQRILFEASVRKTDGRLLKYVNQSGSIPIKKVSLVGISTSESSDGCSFNKSTLLTINSSGGETIVAIPHEKEAARIQGVIDVIISRA